MNMAMPNLKSLIEDMRQKDWTITAFNFIYKKIAYIVVCESIPKNIDGKKPENLKYYIAKLTFIDKRIKNKSLSVYANTHAFKIPNIKEFREFFNIQYSDNIGDIFQQFYQQFSKYIPCTMPEHLDESHIMACVQILNKKKSEVNGNFCFAIFRNGLTPEGKQKHRSPYNADKTKLLRSDLYEYFKNDDKISFRYTTDPSKKKETPEIIQNFIDQQGY